jgi:hypothetical protein
VIWQTLVERLGGIAVSRQVSGIEVHCKNSAARLPLNMEMTLLQSNPCGISQQKYHMDLNATASFPRLGGKRAVLFLQCT